MMIDINGVLVVYYNRIELVIPEGIMVLSQKETTIAYRCPACGAAVESMVGAFALSADMLRLKCPCGGSELTVVYTKDKKVRLTVPCYVCPRPHVFTVAQNLASGGSHLHERFHGCFGFAFLHEAHYCVDDDNDEDDEHVGKIGKLKAAAELKHRHYCLYGGGDDEHYDHRISERGKEFLYHSLLFGLGKLVFAVLLKPRLCFR